MRPIYIHISYMALTDKDGDGKFTYGSWVAKFEHPTTVDKIREIIADKFDVSFDNVQIMSITVLPKRVYKMLKGIQ